MGLPSRIPAWAPWDRRRAQGTALPRLATADRRRGAPPRWRSSPRRSANPAYGCRRWPHRRPSPQCPPRPVQWPRSQPRSLRRNRIRNPPPACPETLYDLDEGLHVRLLVVAHATEVLVDLAANLVAKPVEDVSTFDLLLAEPLEVAPVELVLQAL